MAKQFWRLIDKPILAKEDIFGKRIRWIIIDLHHHLLVGEVSTHPDILLKRVNEKSGDGQSISILNDPWISAPHSRSTIPKNQNQILNPTLKVEHLINSVDLSWNTDLLNAYFHPENVKIIKGLAISRCQRPDSYGWNFTSMGLYTVKSGYITESQSPNKGQRLEFYGQIQNHCWHMHGN